MLKKAVLTTLIVFSVGCDATGPSNGRQVAVRFNAVTTAAGTGSLASMTAASVLADHVPSTGAITLTGTNGTLIIQDIRFIVSELELERSGAACTGEDDADDCEEFEGGPFLVNLLDGTADEVVTAMVPNGTYTELEFEVEDLDVDADDDAAETQVMQTILANIRQTYPNFPSTASMVVHGTFNGEPFTVYFDAEIEVEQAFATPFRVPEDGSIRVNLDPAVWFKVGGEVMNLRALNGQTVQFHAEFENGVIEVRRDD